MRFSRSCAAAALLLLLGGLALVAGCAQSGPRSSSAQPVLYPNEAYNRMGQSAAQAQAHACEGKAADAGISPKQGGSAVARGATQGAAVGGAVGAVGGILHGGGLGRAAETAAKGAVVGGTAGAVRGSFHDDKANPTYRAFVSRCLKEQGLEVIGWE